MYKKYFRIERRSLKGNPYYIGWTTTSRRYKSYSGALDAVERLNKRDEMSAANKYGFEYRIKE